MKVTMDNYNDYKSLSKPILIMDRYRFEYLLLFLNSVK